MSIVCLPLNDTTGSGTPIQHYKKYTPETGAPEPMDLPTNQHATESIGEKVISQRYRTIPPNTMHTVAGF